MSTERSYLTTTVEVSERPTIPAGAYVATLEGIEEVDHELYGTRWTWRWIIPGVHPDTGGDFDLLVWTPPRISNTGIAREMAAALGQAVTKGAQVDLGAMRGRQAQLTVTLDTEAGRNRVAAVTPAPTLDPVSTAVDPEYEAWKAARQAAEREQQQHAQTGRPTSEAERMALDDGAPAA